MNVDAGGHIRQRDNIDVVCWVLVAWLNSWWLNQSWKAFAIAVDCRIYPVSDRYSRSSVRIECVDIALLGCCTDRQSSQYSASKSNSSSALHLAANAEMLQGDNGFKSDAALCRYIVCSA